MSRIRLLDPHVVNKIAAGEVIERPASVVKELLENSLDALATRVEVDVAAGGSELIRIVDDGEGIHRDDLLLAVSSHATSKIGSDEDLFRVRTLGFRGEALASIAAVSQLRVRSRRPGSDSGCEVETDAGKPGAVQPCGCPVGTLVEVRRLFFNTPVRRKFLKTTATEFGHISEQFTRIAIAHPRLHAVLRHNGKVVYELPAAHQLIERLRLFFGSELAENLIWVESQSGPVRLWGYVAHPSQSKSTRKGQYLFLNGRWIQDRSLQHALGEAYRGLLMVGRYPVSFLFLEMPPDLVDVNVHPTKAEVRFRDAQQLYRQLLSTLRTKFLGMDLNSPIRVPGASRPAEEPSPVTAERQRELQVELANWAKQQLAAWTPTEQIGRSPGSPSQGAGSRPDRAPASAGGFAENGDFTFPTPFPAGAIPSQQSEDQRLAPGTSERDVGVEQAEGKPQSGSGPTSDSTGKQPGPAAHFPPLRVMQIHDCYLVVETDDGLTVIDQHALHERVLYEQLRRRVLDGAVESQRMLVPDPIELSAGEAALLIEHRDLLARLGFGIEEFGGNTILVTGYPPMLARADPGQLIRDVAEQLSEAGSKPTRRDLLDKLLHMMSCKAAIKAGQRLKPEEMESLLAQRHLIDDAHHCPHGRPTALVLSREELDRQFGRLG